MQSENPLVSDFVKMLNAAAGTFAGMTREARDSARERMKEAIGGMDFVTREEFDAVKAMAAAARDEVDALRARLDALEGAGPPAVVKPRKPAAPKGKAAPQG
jgi:BMFP domain-containing protein YqiC